MEPLCEVRESSIHGKGVFALCEIKEGAPICKYDGFFSNERPEYITQSDYVLNIPKGYVYGFKKPRNSIGIAQLINDANAITEDAFFDDKDGYLNIIFGVFRYALEDKEQVNVIFDTLEDDPETYWAIARRTISPGEELTCSYGYNYWLNRLPEKFKDDVMHARCYINRKYAHMEYKLCEKYRKSLRQNDVLIEVYKSLQS